MTTILKTRLIGARVSNKIYNTVNELATESGLSVSDWLRFLILKELEKNE